MTARSEHISARFRPSTAATLDRLRKEMTRTKYLEKLVVDEERRQKGNES